MENKEQDQKQDWKTKNKKRYYFPNRELTIPKDQSKLDHNITFSIATGAKKVYYYENKSLRKADSIMMKQGLAISYKNIQIIVTSWNEKTKTFNYQIKQIGDK